MPVISLTKELSGDNPYSFPARHTSNLITIENAFLEVDTTLTAVSGVLGGQISSIQDEFDALTALQGIDATDIIALSASVIALETYTNGITGGLTQLDDRYLNLGEFDFATSSELQTVSGDLQAQIISNDWDIFNLQTQANNNYSTIVSVSGNLQNQIDNFVVTTDFISLTDTPSSYAGANGYLVSVSGNSLIFKPESSLGDGFATDAELQAVSGALQAQITSNDNEILTLQTQVTTISGDLNVVETYIDGITGGITQLDDRFVNVTGDIMSGDLTVNATIFANEIGSHDIPVTEIHTNQLHLESLSGGNAPAYEEGMLFYDGDKRVLKLYNDIPDVALDIGEELWIRVVNKTGVTIPNGSVVYINGSQGSRPTIALASSLMDEVARKTIGVATHNIEDNQEGLITTEGLVRDFNTTAFDEGDELWLSTDEGQITKVRPPVPYHAVRVGFCVTSGNGNGTILVKIFSGDDLSELHDVAISGAQEGQLLTYSQSLSAWSNQYNILDYPTNTLISSISGNLQNQLDNFSTDFIGLTDTPSSYTGANSYVLTVSGGGIVFTPQDEIVPATTNIRGQEECIIGQQVYTISYGQTISGAQPITSLVTPTSASTIFVEAILDVTDTNFKVILSEAPATSGYAINWVTSFGSALNSSALEQIQQNTDDISALQTQVESISSSGYSGGDLTVTGNITIEQGVYTSITNISGNYTTIPTDNNIFCNGNFTLTLHDASTGYNPSSSTAQEMMFNNIGTETVNISGTIQGDVNPDLLSGEIFNIISNGSGWYWKS